MSTPNAADHPGPQPITEPAYPNTKPGDAQSSHVCLANHLDAIPAELRNLPQWLAWREELRQDGTKTKPPKNPHTGLPASPTNPNDWGTFEEAVAAVERHRLDGIGFALTSENGIVGIDLDKCRNPETGELTRMAEQIVGLCASYTEISPSGCGLRIFVRGELPEDGRRQGGFEIYKSARYLTVTGDQLDAVPGYPALLSSAIESRQEAIDGIYSWIAKDAQIAAKARKEDSRFEALWKGDTSEYDHDDSRADLALCNMLAPRCNHDPDQMGRVFRWSGLMRPKWDEKHSTDGRTDRKSVV